MTKTKKPKKTASKCSQIMSFGEKEKILKEISKITLENALDDMKNGSIAPNPFLQLRAAMLDFEILWESRK